MVLNGNENDLILMRQRMDLRQQKHKKNRAKNRVKVECLSSASTSSSLEEPSSTDTIPKVGYV